MSKCVISLNNRRETKSLEANSREYKLLLVQLLCARQAAERLAEFPPRACCCQDADNDINKAATMAASMCEAYRAGKDNVI